MDTTDGILREMDISKKYHLFLRELPTDFRIRAAIAGGQGWKPKSSEWMDSGTREDGAVWIMTEWVDIKERRED